MTGSANNSQCGLCLLNYLPTCWTCWIFTSTSACWSICPPVASEENRATPFYLLAPTSSGPLPTKASAIPILAWDTALRNCCNQIYPFDFCQTKYWSLRGGAAAEMRLLSLRNWMFNHNFPKIGRNNIFVLLSRRLPCTDKDPAVLEREEATSWKTRGDHRRRLPGTWRC